MRVILWILGQPQTTKSSSAPKPAIAVQGEAEAGFFRVPRILEEENQAEIENQAEREKSAPLESNFLDSSFSPSLRDDLSAKQSTTPSNHTLLDSSAQVESMDSKDTSATTALESLLMSDND